MAKRSDRPVKRVDDSEFRVYRLPKSLRLAASKAKEVRGLTVRQFLDEVVVGVALPELVAELRGVLGERVGGPRGPARLPFSVASLASLRAASAECGLPASLLFEAALLRSSVASSGKGAGQAKGRRGRKSK